MKGHLKQKNSGREGGKDSKVHARDEGNKINKQFFLQEMKKFLPEHRDSKETSNMEKVFEKLFNRFKIQKCEIKQHFDQNTGMNQKIKLLLDKRHSYISEITNKEGDKLEPVVDVYEIIIALCIYIQLEFKERLLLLFDVTDVDNDGYINEKEIKNLIYTVNLNFAEEDRPINTRSSILNQSLASVKAKNIYDSIIYHVTITNLC